MIVRYKKIIFFFLITIIEDKNKFRKEFFHCICLSEIFLDPVFKMSKTDVFRRIKIHC